MIARSVSMAPSTKATRAGQARLPPDQVRPMASQPQTIATGPRMIPSTKNPAIAQMTPMIPSVARSGPVRDHVRPRDRGYLRVPCPKPAIINSLTPLVGWVRLGFNDASTPGTAVNPPALRRAAPLRQRAAAPSALRAVRALPCGGLDLL